MSIRYSRRSMLRGMLGGAAINVGLPLLDCFLNDHGTALAANAGPLPVRFGTWFWGCGVNPERWIPSSAGAGYELSQELAPLAAVKEHVSVLSGYKVILDGRPNYPHYSGVFGTLTGSARSEEHTSELQSPI